MTQHERNLEILAYAIQGAMSFKNAKKAFPAPKRKYYFVNSLYINTIDGKIGNGLPQTEAIDIHPFEWLAELNKFGKEKKMGGNVLLSWQEITEEEYTLYKKLEEELNA
jgi:hypothetical protein